jgi:TPR repeat protein
MRSLRQDNINDNTNEHDAGNGNSDKELQQAVPWVSDPEQRDDETRRLQEDVMAAARRLGRESSKLASEPRNAVGFRVPTPRESKPSGEEAARNFWSQLKTERMLQPTRDGQGLPSMAMAAGFLGAMAVSATVALVVVNVVHRPTISADVASEARAAKGNSFAAATLGDLAKISEAQAKMKPADEPVPAETFQAAAPQSEEAAPRPPAPQPVQLANAEPKQEIAPPVQTAAPIAAAPPMTTAPPITTAPPQAAAVPDPRPSNSLPSDEIASLLKRGRDLIAAGDIASARLVLTHVADAGSAEAAFTLAGTFDPTVLASLRAVGVQGDPAKARAWYTRAAELGSLEASQRLQALR